MSTATAPQYPTLESITRPTVGTLDAAFYLNRAPNTLRIWACRETGPIKPLRVSRRLAWPVKDLRTLLGVSV